MGNLLKLKPFPKTMMFTNREYVKLTRPEDLKEYDYVSNLNKNSKIDFGQFNGGSYDITWEGWNYIFPILQREYLFNRCWDVINFLDDFIWKLSYCNGIKNFIAFLDLNELYDLKQWFANLRLDSNTPSLIKGDNDEILSFLNVLNDEITNRNNHIENITV